MEKIIVCVSRAGGRLAVLVAAAAWMRPAGTSHFRAARPWGCARTTLNSSPDHAEVVSCRPASSCWICGVWAIIDVTLLAKNVKSVLAGPRLLGSLHGNLLCMHFLQAMLQGSGQEGKSVAQCRKWGVLLPTRPHLTVLIPYHRAIAQAPKHQACRILLPSRSSMDFYSVL